MTADQPAAPSVTKEVEDAIKSFAGANRLYESHRHDIWRGDEPWKDLDEAYASLLAAIEKYRQQGYDAGYAMGRDEHGD